MRQAQNVQMIYNNNNNNANNGYHNIPYLTNSTNLLPNPSNTILNQQSTQQQQNFPGFQVPVYKRPKLNPAITNQYDGNFVFDHTKNNSSTSKTTQPQQQKQSISSYLKSQDPDSLHQQMEEQRERDKQRRLQGKSKENAIVIIDSD